MEIERAKDAGHVRDSGSMRICSGCEPGKQLPAGFLRWRKVFPVKEARPVLRGGGGVAVNGKVKNHGEFILEAFPLDEGQAELLHSGLAFVVLCNLIARLRAQRNNGEGVNDEDIVAGLLGGIDALDIIPREQRNH